MKILPLHCKLLDLRVVSVRASFPGGSGGRAGKEGELATSSLEFECLHRKTRCEMPIGGGDIGNDVITLGSCFSMFVYIRARFRFALISGKSDTSVDREPQGNWRWNSNSRDVVASSPSFSRPTLRVPRRVHSQAKAWFE